MRFNLINKNKLWYKITDNLELFHRNKAPSLISKDGETYWDKNGKNHRDNGPSDNAKEFKMWCWQDKHLQEETFWNK